jgi:hypothetical protein
MQKRKRKRKEKEKEKEKGMINSMSLICEHPYNTLNIRRYRGEVNIPPFHYPMGRRLAICHDCFREVA